MPSLLSRVLNLAVSVLMVMNIETSPFQTSIDRLGDLNLIIWKHLLIEKMIVISNSAVDSEYFAFIWLWSPVNIMLWKEIEVNPLASYIIFGSTVKLETWD